MHHRVKTAGLAAAALTTPALAQGGGERYYGPHMWDGGWWMFFGPLWMIIVIAVIVAVVVLVVRWSTPTGHFGSHGAPVGKAPLDILKERFAHGEIDKDEFEERRKLLE